MESKTISYLNGRAWYRFLKVGYALVLIIILGGFNLIVFSEGIKKIDQEGTVIQCNLGSKKTFTAKSIGLVLSSNDFVSGLFDYKKFFEGYNEYDIKKISNECFPKRKEDSDIYDSQKMAELINKFGFVDDSSSLSKEQVNIMNPEYKEYKQQTNNLIGNSKSKYLDFSFKMFDIVPKFDYNTSLQILVFGNLIILAIFEVTRRIFYYIALGSFSPKK